MALLLEGVHIGEHCLVVALGIAADGQTHALGLWEGATENAAVCLRLLAAANQNRSVGLNEGPDSCDPGAPLAPLDRSIRYFY